MTQPPSDNDRRKEVRWAWVRLALGQLQMFGAVVGVVLLFQTGLSDITMIVVAITTALMLLSRALFRNAPNSRS